MTRHYAKVDQLPEDAQVLESTRDADRYATGPEDSQWFCSCCGYALDDDAEPCPTCAEWPF